MSTDQLIVSDAQNVNDSSLWQVLVSTDRTDAHTEKTVKITASG